MKNLKVQNWYYQLFLWVLFALCFLLLYLLNDALLPFIIGIVLAYLLTPVERYIFKFIRNKALSSFIAIFSFIITLTLIIEFSLPLIYEQLLSLYNMVIKINLKSIEEIINESHIIHILPQYLRNTLSTIFYDIPKQITNFFVILLKQILLSGTTAMSFFMILIIAPFTAFYILKDKYIMQKKIITLIPKEFQENIKFFFQEIHDVFIRFLKAQFLISSILSVFYTFSFFLMGFNSFLSLGLITGIFTFIPYAGTIISVIFMLVITSLEFKSILMLVILCCVFIIGHLLEMFILSPKILGDKLGLHPLITVISIIISAKFFGIFGMFCAVPLAVLVIMILKILVKNYKSIFLD